MQRIRVIKAERFELLTTKQKKKRKNKNIFDKRVIIITVDNPVTRFKKLIKTFRKYILQIN